MQSYRHINHRRGKRIDDKRIPSGPQAQGTIKDVDVVTNSSVNNINPDPISLELALPIGLGLQPSLIDQTLSAETIDPASAPAPVVFEQPLPPETIDPAPAPALSY